MGVKPGLSHKRKLYICPRFSIVKETSNKSCDSSQHFRLDVKLHLLTVEI